MYDVRKASSVYASMAGVLSGFAFTAIVLLATRRKEELPFPLETSLGERALLALIVAFIGCGISGFTFAVVAGEAEPSRHSQLAAFFAGNGLIVSVAHLLWGVSVLASQAIPTPRAWVGISLGTMAAYVLAPLFLLLAVRELERDGLTKSSSLSFGIGYCGLFLAGIVWAIWDSYLTRWSSEFFYTMFLGSGLFVVAVGATTLVTVGRLFQRWLEDEHFSSATRFMALVLTSIVLCLLTASLPQ